ncbi:MAG: ECF transporter S component [Clostridia bacterium]|nr:ECF transporter S component [Clostridia bacterium]
MKRLSLRELLFLALCCDLGLVCKRLVSPAANVLTGFLRIPGGVGTGFSLLFLTVACELVPRFGCATAMGFVQAMIALFTGHVGSMGALSPIGYTVPGLLIDLCFALCRRASLDRRDRLVLSGMAGSLGAALTANLIVFRLRGTGLLLYALVAATTGALCGLPACRIVTLVAPALQTRSEPKRRNP